MQRDIPCEYGDPEIMKQNLPLDEQHPLVTDSVYSQPSSINVTHSTNENVDVTQSFGTTTPPTLLEHVPEDSSILSGEQQGNPDYTMPLDADNHSAETQCNIEYNDSARGYTEILRDILGSRAASPIPIRAETGPNNNMDFWNSIMASNHPFGDFMTFPHPNSHNFGIEHFDFTQLESRGSQMISSFEQMVCTAATQAFKASGWDWGPTHQDSLSAETTKLILPPECANYERSSSNAQAQSSQILRHSDRNRLLSLLLQHCDKEQWIKIAPTFPSEPFLDHLLHRFLESQQTETLEWFHIPTFSIDTIKDELLAAIIAIGACLTPHDAVQRFGYVMPDILRYAIIDRLTHDNATSRDVQLLHGWITQASISIWSGNKRQMEIGEGNYQLVVTIIRRARWLRREQYQCIYPEIEDESETLHGKWQQWISQETKKRLIYRAFLFDMQISMINHVDPLMSYAEMRIPLPEPNSLWRATTAEQWKTECLNRNRDLSARCFTLTDVVRITMSEGYHADTDLGLRASFYALYAFWRLIWEYLQLSDTLQSSWSPSNGSVYEAPSSELLVRRETLLKSLNVLRRRLKAHPAWNTPKYTEALLLLEYLSMALLAPLRGLQAFAGREGEQEARRIYPVLQGWIQTREARQSIWHAGQVYKAAKALSTRHLRGLSCMLVYQASVTFWVFGILMKARRQSQCLPLPLEQDLELGLLVWLDGEDDDAVRKFVTVSEGVPALQRVKAGPGGLLTPADGSSICLVEDANATMNVAIALLRRPLNARDGAQSALVESTTRLMEEIAKVAQIL